MAFDIPEYTGSQAQVVASLNKPWPVSGLPGQWDAREQSDDRFNNGIFELRHADGAFYAPVKRFSKTENMMPEKVTLDDLGNIDNIRFRFASAFDSTLSYDVSPSSFVEGTTICEGEESLTGDWESLKVRDIDPDHDHRDKNIKQVAQSLKFALIDGDLHLRLEEEPRIRYVNFPDEVFISIEQNDLLPPKLGGFFRLDRMEDCLDHVAAAYPGKPIKLWVRDLSIYNDAVLQLEVEEMALRATAWEVVQSIMRFGNLLNENPDVSWLVHRLGNIRLDNATEAEFDYVSEILNELAKHDLDKFGVDNQEIAAAVNRWQVRPVERGLAL
ncbi:hypothetical protein [Rhizobium sp. MHM7A]|uniref:hypothetical protein n=1 Tax=Rhizobium sp. MHM7A TaxID=2583233 RepID=UPI001106F831|nr:hypothetical protein [Rhizobium sp. MHM7A]TLX17108.1 hypothetical protein FFR93_07295 [Rhizobium sp. MHM7A]